MPELTLEQKDQLGRQALVVAAQIDASFRFSLTVWATAIIAGGVSAWLHSWVPMLAGAAFLPLAFFNTVIRNAREVEDAGISKVEQLLLKRRYGTDPEFKQLVDYVRKKYGTPT